MASSSEFTGGGSGMPYVQYIWAFVFAVFFYKVGDMEFRRGYLACLASIAVSAVALMFFKFGSRGLVLMQVLLFCFIWAVNIFRGENVRSWDDFKAMWRKNEKN
jgi:uncharacterized membrane protein YfcA